MKVEWKVWNGGKCIILGGRLEGGVRCYMTFFFFLGSVFHFVYRNMLSYHFNLIFIIIVFVSIYHDHFTR